MPSGDGFGRTFSDHLTVACSVVAWAAGIRRDHQELLVVAQDLLMTVGNGRGGGDVVVSAEIDWQAGQIERLRVTGEEREPLDLVPLDTLAGTAVRHRLVAGEATGRVG